MLNDNERYAKAYHEACQIVQRVYGDFQEPVAWEDVPVEKRDLLRAVIHQMLIIIKKEESDAN